MKAAGPESTLAVAPTKVSTAEGQTLTFEAVMTREDRTKGFFVAFGYSSHAEAECAAFYKKSGRIIKLITVQEILDEEHVQKM